MPRSTDLRERLDRGDVVLIDGGLATDLEAHGACLDDPLWSAKVLIESPDEILATHRRYVAAGVDALVTATYQASFAGMAARGMNDAKAEMIIRRAVALTRRAADEVPRPVSVIGSVGPYGAFLADGSEYRGDYRRSRAEYDEFHRSRLKALIKAGVDGIAIETMPRADEAAVIVELVEELAPSLGSWVAFTTRDGIHTVAGEPLDEAAEAVSKTPTIIAVGVNCSSPSNTTQALEQIRRRQLGPLVAYPNSGEEYAQARWVGHATIDIASLALRWVATGARIIGGCCRVTPATIARLHADPELRRQRAPSARPKNSS